MTNTQIHDHRATAMTGKRPRETSDAFLIIYLFSLSFTMEGGDSQFAKFTVPALKAFLEARNQSVSGNKQGLVARAIGCLKPHFLNLFFLRTRNLPVSRETTQRHLFFLSTNHDMT